MTEVGPVPFVESPRAHPSSHGRHRPIFPRTRRRRVLYALTAVLTVMVIGTLGFHLVAGEGWVDAFYFESMLATGQGPPFPLPSDVAKVFASVMAFVSVGSVITSLVFTLGPVFAELWREGVERVEAEAHKLEVELRGHDPPAGGRRPGPPPE